MRTHSLDLSRALSLHVKYSSSFLPLYMRVALTADTRRCRL